MAIPPEKVSLEDKLVLVTGGARRVGQAIAKELALHGAQVAIHYRESKEEAQALAKSLGRGSFAIAAELRDPVQVEALCKNVRQNSQSGKIDHLVNNAALFRRTPFRALSDEAWQEMLDVNLTAPMRCVRWAQVEGLSSVVNLIDIAAWQPWKAFSAYAVSKAGLLHLTRILAKELAPTIRVNAVAPGTSLFPEDYDEASKEQVLAKIPLQRIASPEEIARTVRFLLEEPYLTGVCLPVDGGQGLH